MANSVRISVVICTRNRSTYLAQCLQAIEAQTLQPHHYEVIVVDNGSSDDTGSVVAPFCRRRTNFRYVAEERVGLSVARNTGVRSGHGDIVAFTDDDAAPEPSWLEQILRRFQELSDDAGVIGGDVIP